jgi:acyl carrier protein
MNAAPHNTEGEVTLAEGEVTLADIAALVRHALRSRRGRDLVLTEDTKVEDLDLSSLQLADIVFRLEEEKGVRFNGSDVSELSTIGELVQLANQSRLPTGA